MRDARSPKRPPESGGQPGHGEEVAPSALGTVEPAATTTQTDPGGDIAARVREARRGVGLTQLELARIVGVSPHTVWCWEAGRMKPTHEHRVAVAFHCERDVGELEGRAGSARDRLREAVRAFLDAADDLPERDIDSIWRFVRFLRWRAPQAHPSGVAAVSASPASPPGTQDAA